MADAENNPRAGRTGVVPPPVVGSPVDMPAAPDRPDVHPALSSVLGDVPWWRPGTLDVLRVLGWRWVLMAPALAVGVGVPLATLLGYSRVVNLLAPLSIKALALAWGVILSLGAWAIRNAVRKRRDPFCIHCGYSLVGLGESGRCPECGRGYSAALTEEYRKDPHFFAHRHREARRHPAATPFTAGTGTTADDGTQ